MKEPARVRVYITPCWRAFFNTYWKLIYGVAIKAGLTPTEAQDVVQETVLAVTRNIGEFKYDPAKCAFKTWLMRVTRSRISNQFRRKNREGALHVDEADGYRTPLIERIADPAGNRLEALWDAEWENNLMDAAITRVKRRVPAEQYQIFDFYVMKEWPVLKVSQAFGVNVGQVYLVKHRIAKLIKAEV